MSVNLWKLGIEVGEGVDKVGYFFFWKLEFLCNLFLLRILDGSFIINF